MLRPRKLLMRFATDFASARGRVRILAHTHTTPAHETRASCFRVEDIGLGRRA